MRIDNIMEKDDGVKITKIFQDIRNYIMQNDAY